MLKTALSLLAIAIAIAGSLPACKKDEKKNAEPTAGEKAPEQAPEKAPEKPAKTDPATAAVLAVMAPYETCRQQLAGDKTEVGACAEQIAAAAEKVSAGASADTMKAVATAARALAEAPADDIEKIRLAFGEVSRPIEALLVATPAAAARYRMFECPMAKGFKRWAQPGKDAAGDKVAMANPYMGAKMLTCGSEVHDHHRGAGGGAMKGHETHQP